MSLMTSSQLCEELNVSQSSLSRYRALGLPHLTLPSGRLRYDYDTVLAWIEGDLVAACEALEDEDEDEDESEGATELLDEDGDCIECADPDCAGCTKTEACGDDDCESCAAATDDDDSDEDA